jgi:adenosylhomocysteine nucleosidase
MKRIAIIAAMPGELKPLVRGWQHECRNGVEMWRWKFDEGEWIASCAGAGVDAATRAFAEIEKDGPVSSVISTGWAGALNYALTSGQAYWLSGVIDANTGERFRVAIWSQERWLVTSPKVADEPEKQRLAATYKADLVDMEAAAIARLAQMRGIPFYCIKGVSDGFREKLPDFNRFIAPDGRFKIVKFVSFALFRPWYWPALIRMGENGNKAAQGIAASLLEFLDERDYIRKRNGYPTLKR